MVGCMRIIKAYEVRIFDVVMNSGMPRLVTDIKTTENSMLIIFQEEHLETTWIVNPEYEIELLSRALE
jgi:hypothetical protein